MRLIRLIGLAIAAATLALPPAPARAQPVECTPGSLASPDALIAVCTRVIEARATTKSARALALFTRAAAYEAKGDIDRAIRDLDRAIGLVPRQAVLFNGRGTLYQTKGDHDRAIADFTEAIRLDPTSDSAYANRGTSYNAKDDDDRAIADYSEAIRLNPKNAYAYYGRGNSYLNKQDQERAFADYEESIRLDPKNPEALANRAHIFTDRGEHERALADYDEALRLEPDNATAGHGRGYVRFYLGNFAESAADLAKLAQRPDDFAPIWLHFARARAGQGDATPELEQTLARLGRGKWPGAAIEFLLGRRTAENLLADASHAISSCAARFYLGQWHLTHDARANAVKEFRTVAETCPQRLPDYTGKPREYLGAVAELKRMGQ